MAAIQSRPLSRAELTQALGHRFVSGALKRALDDLMRGRFVAFTHPEKRGSRLQRYRALRPPEGRRRRGRRR